jgi:hypothetical protein
MRTLAAVTLAAAVLAASLASPNASAPAAAGSGRLCQDIELISVRGSGDTSSTMGVLGSAVSRALAQQATARHVGYDHYGLPYTAVGVAVWKPTMPLSYWLSERQGRNMLRAYIRQLTGECPGSRIGVIGYSQGAQVVGDVFSKKVGGLTARQLSQVKAVVLVADPRFNSQEPYDHGGFRKGRNGLLGARSPGDLAAVAGKIAAWCRRDDIVCQGPGSAENHKQQHYLHDYKAAIVQFLAAKLGFSAHPSGGEGVVSTVGVGTLRFGISTSVDVGRFAGKPDRLLYTSPQQTVPTSLGFDNWDFARIFPGAHAALYRCPGQVGRAPCTTIYAYDKTNKLIGFFTNSRRFDTAHGTTIGTTIPAALSREPGHQPWYGTQVQCPSLLLAAPAGVAFRLGADPSITPPRVDSLFVSVAAGFSDSCD